MARLIRTVLWVLTLASILGASPVLSTAQETAQLTIPSKPFPIMPEALDKPQESYGPPRVLKCPSELQYGPAIPSLNVQTQIPFRDYLTAFKPQFAAPQTKSATHYTDPLDQYSHLIPGTAPLINKVRGLIKDHPQFRRMMKLLVPTS